MKKEEVKIGGIYYLLPLALALDIDNRYKEFGYWSNSQLADYPEKQSLCTGITPVEVVREYDGHDTGKFIIQDHMTDKWWIVLCEYIIKEPYDFGPPVPKLAKRTIRLIRG